MLVWLANHILEIFGLILLWMIRMEAIDMVIQLKSLDNRLSYISQAAIEWRLHQGLPGDD